MAGDRGDPPPNLTGPLFRCGRQDTLQSDSTLKAFRRDMSAIGDALLLRLLPMPAGKKPCRLEARPIDVVKTAGIDGDAIRLRARDVKRVHSAMRTESVLRDAGLEGVGGQRSLAAQQRELLDRDRQVQDALFGADRTVALRQQIEIDPDPKPYPAAVATAFAFW